MAPAVTALQVGWAVGLFVGLGVLAVVVVLLNRVLRPLGEIKRYADRILDAGLAIGRNLDGVDEALTTRELAASLPGPTRAYLERRGAVR